MCLLHVERAKWCIEVAVWEKIEEQCKTGVQGPEAIMSDMMRMQSAR